MRGVEKVSRCNVVDCMVVIVYVGGVENEYDGNRCDVSMMSKNLLDSTNFA